MIFLDFEPVGRKSIKEEWIDGKKKRLGQRPEK